MARPPLPLTFARLLHHPTLPTAAFDAAAAHTDRLHPRAAADVLVTLISHPDAPAGFPARYLDDRRATVRAAAVAASSAPELIADAATDRSAQVRAAAAANPAIPVEQLTTMLAPGDSGEPAEVTPTVWRAALANRACPPVADDDWAADSTFLSQLPQQDHRERRFVTYATVAHHDAIARTLARMDDPAARAAAITNPAALTDDRDLVARLTNDSSSVVRSAVGTDPVFATSESSLPNSVRNLRHQVDQWRDGRSLSEAATDPTAGRSRQQAAQLGSDALDRALAATVQADTAFAELETLVARTPSALARARASQAGRPLPRRSAPPPSALVVAAYLNRAHAADVTGHDKAHALLDSPQVGTDRINALSPHVKLLRYRTHPDAAQLAETLTDDVAAWTLVFTLLGDWTGSAADLADAANRLVV